MSVGNDVYNLTKNDKKQITDITKIRYLNSGGHLLQQWNIKGNDQNNNGTIQNMIKSTKTNSATNDSGATNFPPIANSFMYIETSSSNHGKGVFASF